MKENKKIDLYNLCYATLIDENGTPKCLLGTYKNSVFNDIKTGDKYVMKELGKFYKDGIAVDLHHIIKFHLVAGKKFVWGKKTIAEILEEDSAITKTWEENEKTFDYNDSREVQQTLAIIKPDGIKNATKIIEMIYKEGLKIVRYDVRMLDKEILSEHYSHLVERPFYPELEEYMLSGEVVIMVLEGVNAVERFRNLMGPTDSKKAPKGTIRGEFGTDLTHNAIHGSDSVNNAIREELRFFSQKQKRI